ncbi:GNAT family N-acetyltransferase [Macrococcus capreoli]|uniref:GNAT family N-acetyltransferase n=1 Tax=Macrococcus capreoli TaxID=2982690 RepID=UPI003EE4C5C1
MYKVIPMDRPTAELISRWDFGSGYEFYNINEDPYVIETFLNGHYQTVMKDGVIFGFFCDGESARMHDDYEIDPDMIDIGFALNPSFIGQGYGRTLLELIFDYYADYHLFRLTVAVFNNRAIALYKKYGFVITDTFSEQIENEDVAFYIMLRNQSQDGCHLPSNDIQ